MPILVGFNMKPLRTSILLYQGKSKGTMVHFLSVWWKILPKHLYSLTCDNGINQT